MFPFAKYGAMNSLTLLGSDVLCDYSLPGLSTSGSGWISSTLSTLLRAAFKRAEATKVNQWMVFDSYFSTSSDIATKLRDSLPE